MAITTYAEGELVVTVPKGAGPDDGAGDGDAAAAALSGTERVLMLV
jgi:hypothetical protein